MKSILLLISFIPFISNGQPPGISDTPPLENKGIRFTSEQNWDMVKAKARREGKFIFVDCFATWCIPCKKMDKEVYTNDTVGFFMNEKFISIKVQMDTSKKDDAATQKWYIDARSIMKQYNITSFPSYLFFNPDGEVVHKDIGVKTVNEFIGVINAATDPSQQYYSLLRLANARKLPPLSVLSLINAAEALTEKDMALQLARNYMLQHLDTLDDAALFTKDNISFLGRYSKMITSSDKIFEKYRLQGSKIDSAVGSKDISKKRIYSIVTREMIAPALEAIKNLNVEPNWTKIADSVNKRYGLNYTEENLLTAKVNWYQYKKNWKRYCQYLVKLIDQSVENSKPTGMGGSIYLNNNAWNIFTYSTNRAELHRAVNWVDMALEIDKNDFQVMDTKANLLYKLGKKKQAIALQQKALEIIKVEQRPDEYRIALSETLTKMKKGIPTWPIN